MGGGGDLKFIITLTSGMTFFKFQVLLLHGISFFMYNESKNIESQKISQAFLLHRNAVKNICTMGWLVSSFCHLWSIR